MFEPEITKLVAIESTLRVWYFKALLCIPRKKQVGGLTFIKAGRFSLSYSVRKAW